MGNRVARLLVPSLPHLPSELRADAEDILTRLGVEVPRAPDLYVVDRGRELGLVRNKGRTNGGG